jgi:Sputnik minor capsid protein V18/19
MNVFSNVENSAGYVYYDLQIKNYQNNTRADNASQLKFDDQRTTPIIDRCDAYEMSIVRYQVDTYNLPVYFAEIAPNPNPNPDRMIHSVTLQIKTANNTYKSGIITLLWEQADFTQPVPIPPSQTASGFQVESPYYYCYDYEHVIRIVNVGLKNAMDFLKTQYVNNPSFPDVNPSIADVQSPFFTWNVDRNSATLLARTPFFNTNLTPTDLDPIIEIYFNRSLYSLFNSLPTKKFDINDEFRRHYQIIVDDLHQSRVVKGNGDFGTFQFIEVPQQYSCISNWTPVSSIVFTTSTIPIVVTQLSNPLIFDNGNVIQLSATANNFSTILTDLTSQDQSYRPELLYLPSGSYRWVSLLTNQPLSHVDIQVYWKSKVGSLVPFTLPPGGACSMKILFRKKTS